MVGRPPRGGGAEPCLLPTAARGPARGKAVVRHTPPPVERCPIAGLGAKKVPVGHLIPYGAGGMYWMYSAVCGPDKKIQGTEIMAQNTGTGIMAPNFRIVFPELQIL